MQYEIQHLLFKKKKLFLCPIHWHICIRNSHSFGVIISVLKLRAHPKAMEAWILILESWRPIMKPEKLITVPNRLIWDSFREKCSPWSHLELSGLILKHWGILEIHLELWMLTPAHYWDYCRGTHGCSWWVMTSHPGGLGTRPHPWRFTRYKEI